MDPSLRPVIGEIIHAAPDVEGRIFQDMVATRKGNGGNFTLYASRGDSARWASGLIRGESRAGFIDGKALIVPGVETIDVTDAGTGYFGLNHDVYASNPVLVEDMKRIFKDQNTRPISARRRSSRSSRMPNVLALPSSRSEGGWSGRTQ